jgi:hypothetical protein
MRQEEGIGLAGRRRAIGRDQRSASVARALGRGATVGPAHQALGHQLGIQPGVWASARCTSSLLTPTRKPPPMSLTEQEAPGGVELDPRPPQGAPPAPRAPAPRSGSSRSSTQKASPASLPPRRAAAARGRWSRRGRPPPGSTPRTASRRCPRAGRPAAAAARWAPPGAACRRPGSTPPRRRRPAVRRRSSAPAPPPCRRWRCWRRAAGRGRRKRRIAR